MMQPQHSYAPPMGSQPQQMPIPGAGRPLPAQMEEPCAGTIAVTRPANGPCEVAGRGCKLHSVRACTGAGTRTSLTTQRQSLPLLQCSSQQSYSSCMGTAATLDSALNLEHPGPQAPQTL